MASRPTNSSETSPQPLEPTRAQQEEAEMAVEARGGAKASPPLRAAKAQGSFVSGLMSFAFPFGDTTTTHDHDENVYI